MLTKDTSVNKTSTCARESYYSSSSGETVYLQTQIYNIMSCSDQCCEDKRLRQMQAEVVSLYFSEADRKGPL